LPAQPTVIAEWRVGSLPASARHPAAIVELDGRLYVASRADHGVGVLENERLVKVMDVCPAPAALVADKATSRLFVACENDHTVRVVKGQQVVATWDVGESPSALAVAGDRLFVGFSSVGRLDVRSAADGSHILSILPDRVFSVQTLAVDETARRLYAAAYEQTLIVDLDQGKVLNSVKFDSYATLAIDPARRRWYTNDYDSTSNAQFLVAVDQETGRVVGKAPLGGDPRQALVHPATGRIYVANQWSNTVSVIDPERLNVLATVAVGLRPSGLCFDPAGRRLYITNDESHNIAVLDLVSNQVVATLPLALIPADMVVDPTRGDLYLAMPATNSLMVVRQGQVAREVPAGIEPTALSVDPTSGTIYVAIYVSQILSAFSPDTWKSQETLLSQRPTTVALDARRGRLYAGREIIAVDGPRVIGSFKLTGYIIGSTPDPLRTVVDPSANRLFIMASNGVPGSNGGTIIYAVDAESGQQLQGQLGGISTSAMLLDLEGRRLYSGAGRYGQYRLFVDDPDNLRHITDRPYPIMPIGLALVPASQHLYVTLGDPYAGSGTPDWELSILDTRTLGEVARWKLDAQPTDLVADLKTGRLYIAVGATGRILVVQDVPLPAPPAPTPTISPTPWLTWTPRPTLPPATGTPTRLPPTPCASSLLRSFARFWTPALQADAGCPVREEQNTGAAEQPFERGRMLWRADRLLIYVLGADGRYQAIGDAWVGPAETICEANPPAGLLHPRRGFGLVWCSNPDIRKQLGFGLEAERGYPAIVQETSNGLLWLTDRDQALLLTHDGAWQALAPVR